MFSFSTLPLLQPPNRLGMLLLSGHFVRNSSLDRFKIAEPTNPGGKPMFALVDNSHDLLNLLPL